MGGENAGLPIRSHKQPPAAVAAEDAPLPHHLASLGSRLAFRR